MPVKHRLWGERSTQRGRHTLYFPHTSRFGLEGCPQQIHMAIIVIDKYIIIWSWASRFDRLMCNEPRKFVSPTTSDKILAAYASFALCVFAQTGGEPSSDMCTLNQRRRRWITFYRSQMLLVMLLLDCDGEGNLTSMLRCISIRCVAYAIQGKKSFPLRSVKHSPIRCYSYVVVDGPIENVLNKPKNVQTLSSCLVKKEVNELLENTFLHVNQLFQTMVINCVASPNLNQRNRNPLVIA